MLFALLSGFGGALLKALPYVAVLAASFVLSLVTVPLVREMNRALGMVDKPSARRINKTPVPRGGGLAVVFSCLAVQSLYVLVTGHALIPMIGNAVHWRMTALCAILAAVGFADDKRGLPPVVKLLGQIAVALGVFFWCGISFHHILPFLPFWADLPLTVFWIVGATNAFNLIDGLDGLASGLALIAAIGMAGALFFIGSPTQALVYLSFIGAVGGFVRYNFNPASVFLGDTGSMFLGFFLSVIPLAVRTGDSLLVGLGVPFLTMGVPIFDTTLAILRRTVRALLSKREQGKDEGNGHVMTADTDHLHHRLLRKFASQRKAALALYAMSALFVLTGLGGVLLRDRAAGLYIVTFVVAVVIIVRDMMRVELWDTGRLIDNLAHGGSHRLTHYPLAVTLYVLADILALSLLFVFIQSALGFPLDAHAYHTLMPLRVFPVFLALVFFRAYATVWGRAQISNYIRLFLAFVVGAAVTASLTVFFGIQHRMLLASTLLYTTCGFFAVAAVRLVRQVMRDLFYTLSASRMRDNPDATRVLVIGAGLRYRAFRRELVRSAATGTRFICGLVDDDPLVRGHYIGGIRVDGPADEARRIVRVTHPDEVMIAASLAPERLAHVAALYRACGLPVKIFSLVESDVSDGSPTT